MLEDGNSTCSTTGAKATSPVGIKANIVPFSKPRSCFKIAIFKSSEQQQFGKRSSTAASLLIRWNYAAVVSCLFCCDWPQCSICSTLPSSANVTATSTTAAMFHVGQRDAALNVDKCLLHHNSPSCPYSHAEALPYSMSDLLLSQVSHILQKHSQFQQ